MSVSSGPQLSSPESESSSVVDFVPRRTGECRSCKANLEQVYDIATHRQLYGLTRALGDSTLFWSPLLCVDCTVAEDSAIKAREAAEAEREKLETEIRRYGWMIRHGVPLKVVRDLVEIGEPTGEIAGLWREVDDLMNGSAAMPFLIIAGVKGSGKSTAAARAMFHKNAGRNPQFVNALDIQLEVRDSYKSGSTTSELDVIRKYADASTLIIDDFAAEKASEASTRVLYAIVNARYGSCSRTIVTTNVLPTDPAKPGSLFAAIALRLAHDDGDRTMAERITDRLVELASIFVVSAKSFRPEMRKRTRNFDWTAIADQARTRSGMVVWQ